tara:strand:- start:119 stop:568 length:450 start_codon:yes stop_codon:yes gene_type:complete
MSQKLQIVPVRLREANALIDRWHRHHKPARGCLFCVGVATGGDVVGVAVVGRPVARHLDDGWTAEVVRVATDGTTNACSALYGAAWRAARAIGYRKIVTYTLPQEGGASLRGAGWVVLDERAGGGSWNRQDRPRLDEHPTQIKIRWGKS